MKFVQTAVAVAIAGIVAAPMTATAATTISGLVQLKVQDDDKEIQEELDDDGNVTNADVAGDQVTDVNFAAGDVRVGIATDHALNSGLTGYGNLQLNLDDLTGGGNLDEDVPQDPVTDTDGTVNDRDPINLSSDATVSADNIYVGVKGGFGDIRWGEIPLAVEYGQLANDIHDVGGTVAGGLSYTGSAGPVSFGVNYSPDEPSATGNVNMFGVGGKVNFGGFTFGLGVEDRGELMNLSAGASFAFSGISVGLQYWTKEAAEPAAVAGVTPATPDDDSNIALKLGYGFGNVSLGFTFSQLNKAGGGSDGDEETVIRLDAGYDLGGSMDISTRINSTSTDAAGAAADPDDVLYWRIMLTKNF